MVPRSWEENKKLASWVGSQRGLRKNSKLDNDKIKRLDELGFAWEPDQQVWEKRFQELEDYKQEHGDCLIPDKWLENKQLSNWVKVQRRAKKQGKLDGKKIKRLNNLGFVWNPIKQAWEDRFQELVAYKREHGDCLVRSSWENKKLAKWVSHQRNFRKRDKLDADKIKRLDELGFVWSLKK